MSTQALGRIPSGAAGWDKVQIWRESGGAANSPRPCLQLAPDIQDW
jgi:hypothetical protein